ncbi:unnamed protein product, partial [Medioppia subpectinata]
MVIIDKSGDNDGSTVTVVMITLLSMAVIGISVVSALLFVRARKRHDTQTITGFTSKSSDDNSYTDLDLNGHQTYNNLKRPDLNISMHNIQDLVHSQLLPHRTARHTMENGYQLSFYDNNRQNPNVFDLRRMSMR